MSWENRPLPGSGMLYMSCHGKSVLKHTNQGSFFYLTILLNYFFTLLFWYQRAVSIISLYCSSSNRTNFTQVWKPKNCPFFGPWRGLFSHDTHHMISPPPLLLPPILCENGDQCLDRIALGSGNRSGNDMHQNGVLNIRMKGRLKTPHYTPRQWRV